MNTTNKNAHKIHALGGIQTSNYMYSTWEFILEKFGMVFNIKAPHNLTADLQVLDCYSMEHKVSTLCKWTIPFH